MNVEIARSNIAFPCADAFEMRGYLSRPAIGGPFPGIIFIFEAFGMNAEMQRVADEIAAAGYAVLMPDLFARGNWFVCIRRLLRELAAGGGRGVDDLLAARAWLAQQPFVEPERLAVGGLCLGGGFALILAKTGLFRAAADFYGRPPAELDGACPVIASYGERDGMMMPYVPALEAELARLQIPSDVKVYPGAGHSFMNAAPNPVLGFVARNSPMHAGYDASAARDAMNRLVTFFAAHV